VNVQGLVRQAEVVDVDAADSDEEGMGDSHSREGGSTAAAALGTCLYTRGVRSSHFTLVLQVCAAASRLPVVLSFRPFC
jgi:hypothetical protein